MTLALHLLLLMFELLVCDNLESQRHFWILVFIPLIFISIISIAICIWAVKNDRSFDVSAHGKRENCRINCLSTVVNNFVNVASFSWNFFAPSTSSNLFSSHFVSTALFCGTGRLFLCHYGSCCVSPSWGYCTALFSPVLFFVLPRLMQSSAVAQPVLPSGIPFL